MWRPFYLDNHLKSDFDQKASLRPIRFPLNLPASVADRLSCSHTIVCLVEKDELREKSPEYAGALAAGRVPCSVLPFEIPDRGAPEDWDGFCELPDNVATRLQLGEAVLIHCAGGVGRTAMLAICVLLALGEAASDARSAVLRAGSTIETAPQSQVISWCASKRNGES